MGLMSGLPNSVVAAESWSPPRSQSSPGDAIREETIGIVTFEHNGFNPRAEFVCMRRGVAPMLRKPP